MRTLMARTRAMLSLLIDRAARGHLVAWSWTALILVLATAAGGDLAAQTLENTTIENIATAAYTDANGNAYDDVSDAVTVTVGFTASLSVSAGATSAGPGAGSVGNEVTFTIENAGNGIDKIVVDVPTPNPAGAVITGYQINGAGTIYPDLITLNAALALLDLPAITGSVDITVVYDVPGAATTSDVAIVELTTTSFRDPLESNSAQTTITPGGVEVTADDSATEKLPSGSGPSYTVTFQVTNQGAATALDLAVTLDATNAGMVTIEEINGIPGTTLDDVAFGAGETRTVTVTYSVGGLAPQAATSDITLTVTAGDVAGTPTASDVTVLTVVRPALTLTKTVHASQAGAQNDNDVLASNPVPGDQIWYRIVVDNATGTAAADLTQAGTGVEDDFHLLPVAYSPASLAALTGVGFATWAALGEAGEIITGTVMIPAGSKAGFVFSVTID